MVFLTSFFGTKKGLFDLLPKRIVKRINIQHFRFLPQFANGEKVSREDSRPIEGENGTKSEFSVQKLGLQLITRVANDAELGTLKRPSTVSQFKAFYLALYITDIYHIFEIIPVRLMWDGVLI